MSEEDYKEAIEYFQCKLCGAFTERSDRYCPQCKREIMTSFLTYFVGDFLKRSSGIRTKKEEEG